MALQLLYQKTRNLNLALLPVYLDGEVSCSYFYENAFWVVLAFLLRMTLRETALHLEMARRLFSTSLVALSTSKTFY